MLTFTKWKHVGHFELGIDILFDGPILICLSLGIFSIGITKKVR